MSRKYIVLSLVAGVSIVAVAVAILPKRPNVQLGYAEVTRGPISRDVLISGTLEPEQAVDAGTQVSGTVQALEADFNSRVRAGEVIARLDPSTYDARVAQALAEVAEADADVARLAVAENDARVKLGRAETLAKDDLIPTTDLETARVTHAQAVADLRAQKATAVAARAALKQAQVNRSHTVIHSPIDGVVVNRSVEVGQTLAASVQSPVLFTIADLKRMHLLANIDQSEVGEIKAGTPVTFQVESLGPRIFDATVAELRLAPNVEAAASLSGTASTTSTAPTGAAAARGSSSSATSQTSQTPPASPTASTASTASTSTAQSSATAVGTTGGATSNGPGVITYTAVIAVPNPDSVLSPGTTATITIPVATRTNAVRVPNNALTFRPSTAVFEAVGQTPPQLEIEKEKDPVAGRLGYVWAYDNGRFRAIKVRTGLADEQWTELLSGDVTVGQRLVTGAERR